MFGRERTVRPGKPGERDSRLVYENEQRQSKSRKLKVAQNSGIWD